METRAGLRCVGGRDRMRSRRARPRVQAVLEVKVGKITEGLDSRAARSRGSVLAGGRGVSSILVGWWRGWLVSCLKKMSAMCLWRC